MANASQGPPTLLHRLLLLQQMEVGGRIEELVDILHVIIRKMTGAGGHAQRRNH